MKIEAVRGPPYPTTEIFQERTLGMHQEFSQNNWGPFNRRGKEKFK